MTQFHFIAGLPRSGSTLLAAILRQNPAITASMSSGVGEKFRTQQRANSQGNEAAVLENERQKMAALMGSFIAYYDPEAILGGERSYRKPETVFDTNRMWPSKLPTLVKLFPDCRIICCVRQIAWIMDSIERLVRKNAYELSGIFGYEPGGTVYSRCTQLASSNGLIGFALDALREGFYGEHADRLLLVEYQALTRKPRETIAAIYDWLGLPAFAGHDFENVEQIPGAAEFDARIGTPGLHSIARKVEWRERETVLPPELFASFPRPFWRASNPKVRVIHWEPPGPPRVVEAAE